MTETRAWAVAARVAAVIVLASAALAAMLGLALRPAVPHAHWGLHSTLVFVGWVWAMAFGAHLSADGTVSGVHAELAAGLPPLTITVIALGAGALAFRRHLGLLHPPAAMLLALRVAALTAAPPALAAATLHLDGAEALRSVGMSDDSALGAADVQVGVSWQDTLVLAFACTLVVLLAVVVVHPATHRGRLGTVTRILSGPVVGTATLAAALIPAGLLTGAALYLCRSDPVAQPHLSGHQVVNIVAAAIAYAPNLALWVVTLGAAGRISLTAGTSLGDHSVSGSHGLGYLTGTGTDAWQSGLHGLWIAVFLTPAVLTIAASVVVHTGRRAHSVAGQRARMAAWVASLLVVLPVASRFGRLDLHASTTGLHGLGGLLTAGTDTPLSGLVGSGLDTLAAHLLPASVEAHARIAPAPASFLLLIGYAAVIALGACAAYGLLESRSRAGVPSPAPDQGSPVP